MRTRLVMMLATTTRVELLSTKWGARYRCVFVLREFLLIPVRSVVLEMTVRIAIASGLSNGTLIRKSFGPP